MSWWHFISIERRKGRIDGIKQFERYMVIVKTVEAIAKINCLDFRIICQLFSKPTIFYQFESEKLLFLDNYQPCSIMIYIGFICKYDTVPTFNSCTKCVGSPGIVHDCTTDCLPNFWAWMQGWTHNWSWLCFASYVGHWCAWLIFVLQIISSSYWCSSLRSGFPLQLAEY